MASYVLPVDQLDGLFGLLRDDGHELIGPTLRDGVIALASLSHAAELPIGWGDQQGPGEYRLRRRSDQARFGYVVGQDAWKRFLHPPHQVMFRAHRNETGVRFDTPERCPPKRALIGVRGCDLAAIAIQGKVFATPPHTDADYAARLAATFIVAVDCSDPASTCFCTSFDTGPAAGGGFDLALTEVIADSSHYFVVRSGSEAGTELVRRLDLESSTRRLTASASAVQARAVSRIERHLDTDNTPQLLRDNADHSQFDDVAERCLQCGNCTMVCPTCFCTRRDDAIDISGNYAEQTRSWDSCFNRDFSLAGGIVRQSPASRYRQWLTHKLSTWHDQFGSSGCVGCGRCVTWCPAEIDLVAEVAAIAASEEHTE